MPEIFEIELPSDEEGERIRYHVKRTTDDYPLVYVLHAIVGEENDQLVVKATADFIIPQPKMNFPLPGVHQTFGWKTPCKYYHEEHDKTWEQAIYHAIKAKQPQYLM